MFWKLSGLAIGLLMLVAGCGSQSNADRNHAEMDRRLNSIDEATENGAGTTSSAIIGPDAAAVGGKMRSSAAHPGPNQS